MSTATNADQLETILVPLQKLTAWSGNVRKTIADHSIDGLAASIRALGLLQSLVIRKPSKTKYHVIAGKRRLLALAQLAKEGIIAADFPVPCRVLPKDYDQTEVSLAENVHHETMHPADEFEAFRALIENGHSAADIAARFGTTDLTVEKRLALARVSPLLIQKYRGGELTLDLLQAFTISDDHAAQEQVWNQLQRWNRQPHVIREMLSQDDVPGSDKRAQFVGLEAYEAAGGKIKRDLFADEDTGDGIYLSDIALLNRLVQERLEATAQSLATQGWKWIEILSEPDYSHIAKYRRLRPEPLALTPEKEAELEALENEHEEVREDLDNTEEEDQETAEKLSVRLDEIEARIGEIRAAQDNYPDEIKASAGAILSIDHNGKPHITYGCVRKEDEPAFTPDAVRANTAITSASDSTEADDDSEKKGKYSAALIESLTSYKTAAIAAQLTENTHIALASVVYTLALHEFALDLRLYGSKTCLQISATRPSLQEMPDSPAVAYLDAKRDKWRAQLPANANDIWNWCIAQSDTALLEFLGFLAATSVNAIQTKHDFDAHSRLPHAEALAAALDLNMTRWFRPTAENFFDRISKARILDALREAGQEVGSIRQAMKKGQLAKVAELDLADTAWLPEPLRPQQELREQLRGGNMDELEQELAEEETEVAS